MNRYWTVSSYVISIVLFKEILETAHYTVFVAENGEKAFDVLEKEHVDLIIVDIMMPSMDGYTFTKELRGFNSETPVLMVSAKQLAEDRKKGFLMGIGGNTDMQSLMQTPCIYGRFFTQEEYDEVLARCKETDIPEKDLPSSIKKEAMENKRKILTIGGSYGYID